uniref:Uncharacterized protein n=1 Tax=Tetranychus urticae TaxID=32264 RepID=T1KEZ7_TETUR
MVINFDQLVKSSRIKNDYEQLSLSLEDKKAKVKLNLRQTGEILNYLETIFRNKPFLKTVQLMI